MVAATSISAFSMVPPSYPGPCSYKWESQPEYISACQNNWPGGPRQYFPPRRVGFSGYDVTSFKAGQWNWSLDHLPNILYMVHPRPATGWGLFRLRQVPSLLDMNANEALERWPQPDQPIRKLRFFPLLHGIDVIGNNEHPLFLLALRRLDPAITWDDIHMRMPWPGRRPVFNLEIFQTFAEALFLDPWIGEGWSRPAHLTDPMWQRLPLWAVELNSTRGFAPGLIDPAMEDLPRNRIPWPDIELGVTMTSFLPRARHVFESDPKTRDPDEVMTDARSDDPHNSSTADTDPMAENTLIAERIRIVIDPISLSPTFKISSPKFGHANPPRETRKMTAKEWEQWQRDMIRRFMDAERLKRMKELFGSQPRLCKKHAEELLMTPLVKPLPELRGGEKTVEEEAEQEEKLKTFVTELDRTYAEIIRLLEDEEGGLEEETKEEGTKQEERTKTFLEELGGVDFDRFIDETLS